MIGLKHLDFFGCSCFNKKGLEIFCVEVLLDSFDSAYCKGQYFPETLLSDGGYNAA